MRRNNHLSRIKKIAGLYGRLANTLELTNPGSRLSIGGATNTVILGGETVASVLKANKHLLRIPKNRFMTDSVVVDLIFPDTTTSKTNNSATYLSWRYRMNSVYDPDPLVLSGSVPGHTAWSAFFSNYRVLKFGYDIDFVNMEGFPVDVVAAPSLTDLGANYVTTNELFGNPHAAVSAMGSAGGMDRTNLKGSIDLGAFQGSTTWYLGNDAYASVTNTNPTQLLYMNFGGITASSFTALGVDYRVTLKYTVLYNTRRILLN